MKCKYLHTHFEKKERSSKLWDNLQTWILLTRRMFFRPHIQTRSPSTIKVKIVSRVVTRLSRMVATNLGFYSSTVKYVAQLSICRKVIVSKRQSFCKWPNFERVWVLDFLFKQLSNYSPWSSFMTRNSNTFFSLYEISLKNKN